MVREDAVDPTRGLIPQVGRGAASLPYNTSVRVSSYRLDLLIRSSENEPLGNFGAKDIFGLENSSSGMSDFLPTKSYINSRSGHDGSNIIQEHCYTGINRDYYYSQAVSSSRPFISFLVS